MSLETESRRGEQARCLLDDPLLREAFAAIEDGLQSAWRATEEVDTAGRERLWLMLRLLSRLRGHLSEVIETGRLANAQMAGAPPAIPK